MARGVWVERGGAGQAQGLTVLDKGKEKAPQRLSPVPGPLKELSMETATLTAGS